MRFSERVGAKKPRLDLQVGCMDDVLRTSLWNTLHCVALERVPKGDGYSRWRATTRMIWQSFLHAPVDNIPVIPVHAIDRIKEWFFHAEWYEAYDLVEALPEILSNVVGPQEGRDFKDACNVTLAQNSSGYRFVGDVIVPITSEVEIAATEEALNMAEKHHLAGVNEHLKSALVKLSDRRNPDYRNSIKEAISAVESICRVISGKANASLPDALNLIESKIDLHPALNTAFRKIYGYTSDEPGVRHAMVDENKCDSDDARYMVVSCSAFVNYLFGKANKADLLK